MLSRFQLSYSLEGKGSWVWACSDSFPSSTYWALPSPTFQLFVSSSHTGQSLFHQSILIECTSLTVLIEQTSKPVTLNIALLTGMVYNLQLNYLLVTCRGTLLMEWRLLHDFFGNFSTCGERYYFMRGEIEPTWGEIETNIGKCRKLRKTQNSLWDGGDI